MRARGYTLKVYDCYRPQRSVDAFVAWAKDLGDQRMKREFYPRVRKAVLFKEGYIAEQSGHSRGSTVDLTLVKLRPRRQERYRRGDRLRDCAGPLRRRFRDNTIDMGTGYDCFDPASHPYSRRFRGKVRRNRLALRAPMIAAGFKGLETEWWHFTLRGEPYPETFFDFPVDSDRCGSASARQLRLGRKGPVRAWRGATVRSPRGGSAGCGERYPRMGGTTFP